MHPFERYQEDWSRRTFLKLSFAGLGGLAMSKLMGGESLPFLQSQGGLHLPARAKRVVHLCMAGGPSHLESFDPKPMLDKLNGQPFPESFTAGQQLAQLQGAKLIARGSFTKFRKWGACGTEISELFPHIGSIADDICVVRSMVTEQINHDPAHAFMNSGSILKGRPSMGSWLLYGLGAESQDLPGYVVMVSRGAEPDQPISARQWSAGFLPSKFQGVQFQSKGAAVQYEVPRAGLQAHRGKARLRGEGYSRLNHGKIMKKWPAFAQSATCSGTQRSSNRCPHESLTASSLVFSL